MIKTVRSLIIIFFLTSINTVYGKTHNETSKISSKKIQSKTSENLVSKAQEWIPAHDEFGSSYDAASAILSDTLKKVSYELTKKVEDNKWPYIELISVVGGNLSGVTSIKLTYSCSTPLVIKLSQSDFNTKGNETYSHFQYIIAASDTLVSTTVNIADFKQPDWTPEISKSIPLKLENVAAIYFTPNIDSEVGGKADIAISELFILR